MKFDTLQTLHILFKDESEMNNSIVPLSDIEVFHINGVSLSLTLLIYINNTASHQKLTTNINDHFVCIPKMGLLYLVHI